MKTRDNFAELTHLVQRNFKCNETTVSDHFPYRWVIQPSIWNCFPHSSNLNELVQQFYTVCDRAGSIKDVIFYTLQIDLNDNAMHY